MKIKTVIRIDSSELISRRKLEHIKITPGEGGKIQALSWLYETSDHSLYAMVKRRGGVWNRSAGGWTFADPSISQTFLDAIVKRHPDWPIIGHPTRLPLAGTSISHVLLHEGFEACLVPFPLPHVAQVASAASLIFRVATDGKSKEEVALFLGSADDIAATVESLVAQGAICDTALAAKWRFVAGSKLQVKVSGWGVQIGCDLANPLHYLFAPKQKYKWEGSYPDGMRVPVPWNGDIHTTRKHWAQFKNEIGAAVLEWEGDDPESDLTMPVVFDESRVPGWHTPASNGNLLHAYQKEGARFCASRAMRALIGDEMGVGKTVQAIAAAEAANAARVLVVCPANARYVWDQEILGWGARGSLQHITSQLDKLDTRVRWHIVTYDLLSARAQTWRLNDAQEEKAFTEAFPELVRRIEKKRGGGYPRKIGLDKPLDKVPNFADPKRVAAWKKVMQRLGGELLEQFLAAGPMLVILDEAHRVKNTAAKRTKAIQRIAAGERQLLMLTGTPLRNNEHEAAVLLSLLDAEASTALSKEKGYTLEDVKDYLGHFMIRRSKAEVLPELPEKTRQRIDISDLDPEYMEAYHAALDWAHKSYHQALTSGASDADARRQMRGGIEQARTVLGIAKVRGGEVADLVLDVVENKGCCVVFCAHHQVSDELKAQLAEEKLRVAVVDGRVPQSDRAAVVQDFQDGRLDVFIGGINAAGEAITLTRADTVIFVELDWVPAALLQAEDRIHRVGQLSNCQVIQLVARLAAGDNLDEMMVDLISSKIARIGVVLDEETTSIIAGSVQAELHSRLLTGTVQEAAQTSALADVMEGAAVTDKPVEQEGGSAVRKIDVDMRS